MYNDIIENFSYGKAEQETFLYIRSYMSLISQEYVKISSDKDMLKRFMLAGLFLTYRSLNSMGLEMTTSPPSQIKKEYRIKLLEYKRITGDEILSTSDYLKKIRFSMVKAKIFGVEKILFNFVMKG